MKNTLTVILLLSYSISNTQNLIPDDISDCRSNDSLACQCLDSLKIHSVNHSTLAYAFYYDFFDDCSGDIDEIKKNFSQARKHWDLVPYKGFRYINTYIKIAKHYKETSSDSVIHYLNKIENVPVQYENRYVDNVKEASFLKALAYRKKGDLIQAYNTIDSFYQSPLYDSLYVIQQAWYNYFIGDILIGNPFEALNKKSLLYLEKADSLLLKSKSEDEGNKEELNFNIVYNKALANENLELYENAILYFQEFYNHVQNKVDRDSNQKRRYLHNIVTTSNSLGFNYFKLNFLEDAEYWLTKSIDITSQIPTNFEDKTLPFINLAILYQNKKEYQMAYDILIQAEKIINNHKTEGSVYPVEELEIQMELGNTLLAMDSIDKAKHIYLKTKDKFFEYFDNESHQDSRSNLKNLYKKLFSGITEITYLQGSIEDLYRRIDENKHSILLHDLNPNDETTYASDSESPDLTTIQYGVIRDSIIAITYNGIQGYEMHQLMPLDSFRNLVTKYLDLLNQVNSNEHLSLSIKLYKLLISPLDLRDNKIRIIPIDILALLPFESLQKTNNSNSLLLRTNNIDYQLSQSILKVIEKRSWRNKTIHGFSPEHTPTDNQIYASIRTISTDNIKLNQLKHAQEEVFDIIKLWDGNSSLISKPILMEAFENDKVIHFSGHAISITDTPNGSFLVLNNDLDSINHKLTLDEIYKLNCKNDLIVLSACETSYGKLYESEGIFSLSRAFLYAGAKSVVSTLWNVNDKASSIIMVEFHKELLKGKRKDEALRQAKLTYLSQADPEYQHPYYWAGFIAMGDMSPLFYPQRKWYIVGFTLLGLLLIGVLCKKKISPNRLAA